MSAFVHFRGMSAYSLLEGAVPVKALCGLAKKLEFPALGLSDKGNLFGALEFSEAMAGAGIQPIHGLVLPVVSSIEGETPHMDRTGRARVPDGALTLVARNADGLANLLILASRAFQEPCGVEHPAVHLDWISDASAGLSVLTGGEDGPLSRLLLDGKPELAASYFADLTERFGNELYVELQRYGRAGEGLCEPQLLDYAYGAGAPIIATNSAYFANADDFEAHEALLCIQAGTVMGDEARPRLTPEHRLKSADEMAHLFRDLPEAIDATCELARRCFVRAENRSPILPRFGDTDADEQGALEELARVGLHKRLQTEGTAEGLSPDAYNDRLAYELGVIARMGYAGYFLIVSDFIQWAKGEGIPVGPGRGSGAGSVVAWALTITDLDPMRFGLLFERFLNPERVSMPDFDIDFCPERRDEVIRYVQDKYGHDQVAQIITFGTLQARAVLRDVGRVLQMRYGQVDQLCKLVPNNPTNPVTLVEALETEPALNAARDEDPLVGQLLDIAVKLEGLYRHPSTHAAGVVIGDRPLKQLVPLFRDPRSEMPVTQYNMKWVENAGLVKFDFLGLKTLTIVEKTCALLAQRGVDVDIAKLPLDDAATYQMLANADSVGIFQFESAGMRDALRTIAPDRFEDLIALVALYRPGPMDNIPTYGARKHGREQVEYMHPVLEPILNETYGVIIYQEQVMQIAQDLSGYSLGQADLLRRAMGKKIRAEMDKQRSGFVEGAVGRGVERRLAGEIFELVARFADYGFNKSHAAAYALVAYQTAYLKANHPVEFLAASMTLDMGNTDKLSEFFRDARRHEIEIVPPDVNAGDVGFAVRDGRIHYALAAIKSVGRSVVEHLIAVRGGVAFADLSDFADRIDPKCVGRRAMESLAAAGAFDCIEPNRARVFAGVERIMARAAQSASDRETGQDDMFAAAPGNRLELATVEPWIGMDRLNREFHAVGFFLSGHPLDDYAANLARMSVRPFSAILADAAKGGGTARVACVVTNRQDKRGRKGSRYAIVDLSDPTGQYEAFVFSDVVSEIGEVLVPGEAILATVETEFRNGELRMTLLGCDGLDEKTLESAPELEVRVHEAAAAERIASRLTEPGRSPVRIIVPINGTRQEVVIRLDGGFAVTPRLAGALKAVPGVDDVRMV